MPGLPSGLGGALHLERPASCEAAPVDVPFTKAGSGTGQPLPFPWGFERNSEADGVAGRMAHAAGYLDK